MSFFTALVDEELRRAREKNPPINSLHEGYAVILEEVDELKAEVWKKATERTFSATLAELVQIAAMCQRVAEDVVIAVQTPLPRWEYAFTTDAEASRFHGAILSLDPSAQSLASTVRTLAPPSDCFPVWHSIMSTDGYENYYRAQRVES